MEQQLSNAAKGDDAAPQVWAAIGLKRRTPMQHWIWVQAAFDTLYGGEPPWILFAGDDRSAAGAFASRKRPAKYYALAGARELGEPVDVLYRDRSGAGRLADAALGLDCPVNFGDFPKASLFFEEFQSRARGQGLLFIKKVKGSPFIELTPEWRDPLACFSARRRSDLRRMRRKAEKIGDVEFEILSPLPNEVEKLLDDAIAIEAKSWKSRAGGALAENELQEKFFRRYAQLASLEGIFRICFLKIDGEAAAMQLAVECDDAFWLFKIGYNEKFHACSPGNLLMLESVRYAAEKGLKTYEFLGKAAQWTKVWTGAERETVRFRYYPYNLRGLLAFAEDVLAAGLRRAVQTIKSMSRKVRPKQ